MLVSTANVLIYSYIIHPYLDYAQRMFTLLYAYMVLISLLTIGATATCYRHIANYRLSDSTIVLPHEGQAYTLHDIVGWNVVSLAAFVLLVYGVLGICFYDYFIIRLVAEPLLFAWVLALLGGVTLAPYQWWSESRASQVGFRVFFGGCWLVFVIGCVLFLPERLEQATHALIGGPQVSHGRIMQAYSSRGRSPTHYVMIGQVEYEVPDTPWYFQLRQGQTIAFIHDSGRTTAFSPHRQPWTLIGMLGGSGGVVLWLITGGFACYEVVVRVREYY